MMLKQIETDEAQELQPEQKQEAGLPPFRCEIDEEEWYGRMIREGLEAENEE